MRLPEIEYSTNLFKLQELILTSEAIASAVSRRLQPPPAPSQLPDNTHGASERILHVCSRKTPSPDNHICHYMTQSNGNIAPTSCPPSRLRKCIWWEILICTQHQLCGSLGKAGFSTQVCTTLGIYGGGWNWPWVPTYHIPNIANPPCYEWERETKWFPIGMWILAGLAHIVWI